MKKLIETACGKIKADIVFKNANIVDVFTREIIKGDVAVCGEKIAGIGSYSGEEEIDCTGKLICPGFIDSHVHIESSMAPPQEYARAVLPAGVTTVVTDPHEITNVCGEKGIEFMINCAKKTPLDIYFMLPSCIPATPFDVSGCVIDGKKTEELASKYNFLGLAEMMNCPGVTGCDQDVLKKLSCFDIIDGHAPGLTGNELNGYICVGIDTDHECGSAKGALERVQKGMYVHIRQGTGAKDLPRIIGAVNDKNLSRFCFCTDDKHAEDIAKEGTISHCVRLAIKSGLSVADAVTIATNGYRCYGIKDRGAVAPGYYADLVICENNKDLKIEYVYKNGKLIAKHRTPLFDAPKASCEGVSDTVNIGSFSADDLVCDFDPKLPAIEVTIGTLVTKPKYAESADGLCRCAVIERHKASGKIGKCFVSGIEIENGAFAQSIGHDSHNITVVGDSGENMKKAVDALGKSGGISVVKDGKVIFNMRLPIAGLMSDKPLEEVLRENKEMLAAVNEICRNGSSSLVMIAAFLSLVVIPELKVNQDGLFDAVNMKYVKKDS